MNRARKKKQSCEDCTFFSVKRFLFFRWRSCRRRIIYREPKVRCRDFISWRRFINYRNVGLKKRLHLLGKTR